MSTPNAASELILNADGSVYHLHLLPEHIGNTIITVGDPDRVPMVSKYFDRIIFKIHKIEFVTHTGYLGEKKISVISTGIGTDNIDIVLNELHLLANYDFTLKSFKPNVSSLQIIRIGTSGCIQADLPTDTLLISSYGIGIDNVMQFYRFENTEEEIEILTQFKLHNYFYHTIHPYIFKGSALLFEKFSRYFVYGITLTAPGFYGPQGRKINLPLTHDRFYDDIITFKHHEHRITNIEMETAALYGLSKLLGHECISLNVLLANRATGAFSNDPNAAVEHLIRTTLDVIRNDSEI